MTKGGQGPKEKYAQALVQKNTKADGNTESTMQGCNGAIKNREARMQKPSTKGVTEGTFENYEDHGRELINQFKHKPHLHQQLFCMKETRGHAQEIKFHPFEG